MVSEAHPRKQREAVPGLARVGDDGSVPLGVVPPPPAGASKRSLNSLSRYPMGWTPPHPTPASVRHTGRWLENYQLESQEKP
ncbi:hypothetical protein ACQKFL_23780, partial [Vreelandella titanicae]|uniref:hypothetical protein n=1 Tax=Vreelandella titanicae TaxID=664683 RepID=UPI003CFD54CC